MKKIILTILVFTLLCGATSIKHFYNYSCRIFIESTDKDRVEILKKTETATKELLNEHFFQNLAVELNDTTLQRIAKSGSFIVVDEYRHKISSENKTNNIYIIIEFSKKDANNVNMNEFSGIVTKKMNIELKKRNIIVSKKSDINDYYN